MINEKALCRLMRQAYKIGGYQVVTEDGMMEIMTDSWYIKCRTTGMPRKALGVLVEHAGSLPMTEEQLSVSKTNGVQHTFDTYRDSWARAFENFADANRLRVMLDGYELWQEPDKRIRVIDPELSELCLTQLVSGPKSTRLGIAWEDDAKRIAVAARPRERYQTMLKKLEETYWRELGDEQ